MFSIECLSISIFYVDVSTSAGSFQSDIVSNDLRTNEKSSEKSFTMLYHFIQRIADSGFNVLHQARDLNFQSHVEE